MFFLLLFCYGYDLKDIAWRSYLSGDLEKAREYYSALWYEKHDYNALLDLATICKYMDDYKCAIGFFEQSLNMKKDSDVLSEIGWLYFHLSDTTKAIKYFEHALDVDPENYSAALGLASSYSIKKDFIKTMDYLKLYKKLRGDYAGVDYIFAWNYANFNMYDEAKKYLIETLRKDPTFVEARFPLAQIYIKDGDYNNAWNQYYRILEYIPDHPVALSMVKVIEGKLAKQPEEIRTPFRIVNPTIVNEEYDISRFMVGPKLRVAIGTDSMGHHRKNKRLVIRSFSSLNIVDKKTNKKYLMLPANKLLEIIYTNKGILIHANDKEFLYVQNPFLIIPTDTKNGTVIINANPKNSNPYFKYSDREYRGIIEIYPLNGGFGVVNVVNIETYLLGVVGAEMEPKWPIEALKAQAVIARTEALRRAKKGPHRHEGYHICDAQHCQVYKGVSYETNSVAKAVYETLGEVLTYNDSLAYTFYHSNCGGWIQASEEVSGWGKVPYLLAHPDRSMFNDKNELSPWEFNIWIKKNPVANCNYPGVVRDTEFRWLRIIKRSDLSYKFDKKYGIGEIKSIVILKRSRSGNVNSIKVVGSKKSVILTKEHIIRNSFGVSPLKSTLFNLEINRYTDGRIRNIWFYGGGWGHSIGLCQGGAAGMAGKEKKNYREILEFYFPGTKIKRIKYK